MHQDEPLKQWTPCRDEYLDELNHLEGHGQYTSDHCPSCSLISPSIIADDLDLPCNCATVCCRDCFGEELVCTLCCVRDHAHNPLHVIEVHHTIISFCVACLLVFLQKWNGSYFEPTTLDDIGLRIQLGHPPGKSCSNPYHGYDEFTVIHTNGLHHVPLTTANVTIWPIIAPIDNNSFGGSGILLHTTSLKPVQRSQCSNTFTCKICRARSLVTTITQHWRNLQTTLV